MPKFSIVVPTYNRGILLRGTLESILSISYADFEVIVVDDGSTDNTELTVKSIESDKLRYYKVSNRERGAARNFGALRAVGQYINYFDSDDIAYSRHLILADRVFANLSNPEVFALSYDIRDDSEKLLQRKILKGRVSEFIEDGNDLSCNGIFIRRDIALLHPFSEDRILSASEDYELWLRLSARYPFPCFPSVSHAVVHHKERSTMNFDPQPLIKRKLLMLELAASDEMVISRYSMKRLKHAAYSYLALHIALSGEQKLESFNWFCKALVLIPGQLFSRRSAAIIKHLLLH